MPDVFCGGLGGTAVGLFYLIKGMITYEDVDVVMGGIGVLICLVIMMMALL